MDDETDANWVKWAKYNAQADSPGSGNKNSKREHSSLIIIIIHFVQGSLVLSNQNKSSGTVC